MQLKKIHEITATLVCETGLHIGGGTAEMHIGGIDNEVIKHPITGEPYIPGSSIKGKMRSLLEWRSGFVRETPLGWKDYVNNQTSEEVLAILKLFGVSGSDQLDVEQAQKVGPTRLAFWDAFLEEKWVKDQKEARRLLTEAKTENSINRISGTAQNPRQTERVPSGAIFVFKATMKELDGDKKEDLLNIFLSGLKLIELDGLGGSSSRGYGKVKFQDLKLDGDNISDRFDKVRPFDRS